MMVLQLLWVIFKMPETKGVPLEELEAKLIKVKIPGAKKHLSQVKIQSLFKIKR